MPEFFTQMLFEVHSAHLRAGSAHANSEKNLSCGNAREDFKIHVHEMWQYMQLDAAQKNMR